MAAFIRDPKAFDVVKETCIRQGLPPPLNVVLSSDDVTFLQMASVLTGLGRQLVQDWIWPQFDVGVELPVVDPGTPAPASIILDMPVDFDRWIDDTGWNTSARWPLGGPVTSQDWQTFSQFLSNGTMFRVMWRSAGVNKMEIKPPNVGQNISLRYVSRAWVRDDVDMSALRDHIQKDSDHLLFDYELLVLGLIYKFRERKGFEITAEKRDFEYKRDKLLGDIKGAPTLSLTGRSGNSGLISSYNVPETGYGQ